MHIYSTALLSSNHTVFTVMYTLYIVMSILCLVGLLNGIYHIQLYGIDISVHFMAAFI